MWNSSRREFLTDVSRGMLVAGLGSTVAVELGLAPAFAEDAPKRIEFGALEPLAGLMQDTPVEKLLPLVVAEINKGVKLKSLVAAAALANARCFGGQDYTGYHAFMALPPALEMAAELPENQAALPVLKVLYRNTAQMQSHGGRKNEILHPIIREVTAERTGEDLRTATRTADMEKAEREFANTKDAAAFDALQVAIQDEIDVHRVVLSWRAWSMIDIAGKDYAHTLLRQSVRFCVESEKGRLDRKRPEPGIRTLLPKLFDEYKLAGKTPGKKEADDDWVRKLSDTFYSGTRDQAAAAAAMALAEGFSLDSVGEAMSLAATRLVLGDPGRAKDEPGKPKGSIHGASVGVHASDSANAWRNIAKVASPRNAFASMIVGAYHTAGQSAGQKEPQPVFAKVSSDKIMMAMITDAIRNKDQSLASNLTMNAAQDEYMEKELFTLFLRYAVSEDGALHAEKYYKTIREEHARGRKVFRAQHLAALARVTASESGFPAPGYAEACKLLKV